MTREEAIRCLSVHSSTNGSGLCTDEQHYEAKQIAIQALSQESEIEENIIKYMKKHPNHVGNIDFCEGFYACRNVVLQLDDEEYSPKEQEPCDDAVSREAAIKTVHKMRVVCDTEDIDDYYELLVESFKQLPPVTPQQEYGKWIDYSDEGFIECPFCGHATNCEDNIDELHYCFYCGARMVEPQESE